jgi:hypothetical protein
VDGTCQSQAYTNWWAQADAHSFQHQNARAVVGKRVIWMQRMSDLEAKPAAVE